VILYGLSLALLMVLLRTLELRFLILSNSFEVYAGFIALIFTALGIWLAVRLMKPKVQTVIVEKEIEVQKSPFVLNQSEIEKLGISKRELEVLDKMAQGLSNQEIADTLFVSLNTVKTHSSNLFEKLDVKRRTQAVEKARKMRLIP
jgi:NarL family two-component system response regulator LiaR